MELNPGSTRQDATRSRSGLGVTRLSCAVAGGGRGAEPVLLLETGDGVFDAALPALRADFDVRLVHAPRRADPRRYGCPLERGHWLVGPPEAPDPGALFTTLHALETLLLALEARPRLVASGEGAYLALALASCWGDRLRAVVAVGGALPWLPAEVVRAELAGLPILWAPAPSGRTTAAGGSRGCDLDELVLRGARLTRWPRSGFEASTTAWVDWLHTAS